MTFVIEKSKFKKGLQYLKDLPYSTEVQLEKSDLPFVQDKGYQYQTNHLYILKFSKCFKNIRLIIVRKI